jgi:type I restriction enzyme, S subunit
MDVRPGYKQTEVGVIPEDWRVNRIDCISKLINGRGFKPYEWKQTGLPIIRIQNLNGSDDFNCYSGLYDKKLEVDQGQLLFAWSGNRGTSFGPYIWNGPFGLLNYHTWKVQIRDAQIDEAFFYHALKQLTGFVEGWAHGASALVHVQKWQMEGFQLALPPTKVEQEAIAGALSDADSLIESLEQLIAKKRQIKQGAMQELLAGRKRLPGFGKTEGYKQTEAGVIPQDWETVPLDSVAFVTSGKRLPLGCALTEHETPHPYIRVTDMRPGTVSLADIQFVPREVFPAIRRYRIFKEDIFISVAGTLGIVGKIPLELDGANLTENADRITKITCSQDFLLHVLMSPLIQKTIDSLQTVGAQPKLALTRIRKFVIPLPPTKAEQEAIAKILSVIDSEIAALEETLAKACQIKQGMMKELLTGRIRLV